MEGRWELAGRMFASPVVFSGPDLPGNEVVPVVPCDNAAVKRAVDALCTGYPDAFLGRTTWAQLVAETVLRATGETP